MKWPLAERTPNVELFATQIATGQNMQQNLII